MIKLNNSFEITFMDEGHFVGEHGWIHPTTTIPTYELIYMTEGTAYIFDGDEQFALNKNDLILLPANVCHGGYKTSDTATGFYWLHFTTNDICYLKFPKLSSPENSHATSEFFKRAIHYQAFQNAHDLLESSLLTFLLEYTFSQNSDSKLCHDALSYIRLNISAKLKVTDVSARFGYNADYLSKLFKKHFSFSDHKGSFIGTLDGQRITLNDSLSALTLTYDKMDDIFNGLAAYLETCGTGFDDAPEFPETDTPTPGTEE